MEQEFCEKFDFCKIVFHVRVDQNLFINICNFLL